jgi:hypothetical protein
MEKTLYTLELHESIEEFGIIIIRVPGGWLYDAWDMKTDEFKQGIFVPFNNEFQDKS